MNLEESVARLALLDVKKKAAEWSNLPVELKLKCTAELDYESRFNLRGASKADKVFVDETMPKIDTVCLCNNNEMFGVTAVNDKQSITQNAFSKLPAVAYIMNTIQINEFIVWENRFFGRSRLTMEAFKDIIDPEKVRVEKLTLRTTDLGNINESLELFSTNAKKIMFSFNHGCVNIEDILNAPAMSKTIVKFEAVNGLNIRPIFMKFFKGDMSVGSLFKTNHTYANEFNFLLADFQDRTIDRDLTSVRLRTDNEKKHVCVKMQERDYDNFKIIVVVINQDESDLEKFAKFNDDGF